MGGHLHLQEVIATQASNLGSPALAGRAFTTEPPSGELGIRQTSSRANPTPESHCRANKRCCWICEQLTHKGLKGNTEFQVLHNIPSFMDHKTLQGGEGKDRW